MSAGPEPVTAAHAAVLALIHRAAFPPEEAWSATTIALHVGLPGGFGFIDQRGGMILARTIMDESEILTLAVSPGVRRLGVGAGLLRSAMAHAAAAAARTMFLEVSEANAAARALYGALGFAVVGRRTRYYANGEDALVMRVGLPA